MKPNAGVEPATLFEASAASLELTLFLLTRSVRAQRANDHRATLRKEFIPSCAKRCERSEPVNIEYYSA